MRRLFFDAYVTVSARYFSKTHIINRSLILAYIFKISNSEGTLSPE